MQKSIDEILDMTDEEYTAFVSDLLKDEYPLWNIDELDDNLLKHVHKRPADVERICRIHSTIFSKIETEDSRSFLLANNYNTSMGAAMVQNKISDAKLLFLEGIAFCQAAKHYEAGKSLSQNIFRIWSSGQLPHDESAFFLARITEFYNALEKYQDCVEAICAAALQFADARAFQSAYRVLADAQQIAITHHLLRFQIQALETQATVALMEGDLPYAEKEFDRCFAFYDELKEPSPFVLKTNAALVKLRQNKFGAAKDIYLDLMNHYSAAQFENERRQVQINLLICYRELNDIAGIESILSHVEQDLETLDLDPRIEARLVCAKTYLRIQNHSHACNHMTRACLDIQTLIDQYHRLHYRRGVRERFLSRIKNLLAGVENIGSSEDILHALVLCYSNAILDWMAILDWNDLIQKSDAVSKTAKDQLLGKIEKLIHFGTPFFPGFREKYDDPFEFAFGNAADQLGPEVAGAIDYSRPWREFNELTAQIREAHVFPHPFEDATVQSGVKTVNYQLSTNSSLLFSFICADGCVFILLVGSQFYKFVMPTGHVRQFYFALFDYQRMNINQKAFKCRLEELQLSLRPAINEIVKILETNQIKELVFLPDQITESLPILPSLLASDVLRERIHNSRFIFRTCPALKLSSTKPSVAGPCLCVSNSDDGLGLAEAEKLLVKKAFTAQKYFETDIATDGLNLTSPPVNVAHVLHFTSHSISASAFSDPAMVATSIQSPKNALWLDSVQREAHKLEFTLVVLNGCNTGSTMSWNYFKKFLTNEKVGLSSVFLLNRRCAVLATQWNVPDVVGYIFSALFYKRLAITLSPCQSFILALADMYDLSMEPAINLLEEIPDKNERINKCNAIKKSKTEFPFRDSYCLGMFQHFSLVPN